MITTVILLCLIAAGAAAMGAKYAFGPAPASYHVEIVERDGSLTEGTRKVIHACYRIMGWTLAASGLSLAALALGPVRAGSMATALVAMIVSAMVIAPALVVTYRVEKSTGVQTPWRIAAIFGVVLIAAILSLLI